MTRVYLEREGARYVVDVHGHADTEPLCAAISCLLYTLAGWLHNARCVRIVTERLDPGEARLEWRAETPLDRYDSITAFEMVEIGFLQIRESAPDSLSVEVQESD